VDWLPYFTNRFVDDFASHIRLYTRAMDKAKVANKEGLSLLDYDYAQHSSLSKSSFLSCQ